MAETGRRRSERLFLTFPIRVEGSDATGKPFSEMTRTVVVNRHGARIQLRQEAAAGQTVRITNTVSERRGNFRVVGLAQARTDKAAEWGVECLDEGRNIWGIDFPPVDEQATEGSVVLACRGCGQVALTNISLVEFDVLDGTGSLFRPCKQCNQATAWAYSANPVGTPPQKLADEVAVKGDARVAPSAPVVATQVSDEVPAPAAVVATKEDVPVPPARTEQRKSPRLALRLPIRVRSESGVIELTKSENVSKGGLAFTSEKVFQVGEALRVTCPHNPIGDNIEVSARVVHCTEVAGGGRYFYGVKYEK